MNLTTLRCIQDHFPQADSYVKLNEGQGVEICDYDGFCIAFLDAYTFWQVYEGGLLHV